MKKSELENLANSKQITPKEAYIETHQDCFVIEKKERSYVFRLIDSNNVFKEIQIVSFVDGDIEFSHSEIFFDGGFAECNAHFRTGTTSQKQKLSEWIRGL